MNIFGLACKGLHCAGCGKGIPAAVTVILCVVAFTAGAGSELARALYWVAGVLAFAGIGSGAFIGYMARRSHAVYAKWDGPTYAEQKAMEMESWPTKVRVPIDPSVWLPRGNGDA